MPDYEYKTAIYHRKEDGPTPVNIINQEAVNQWEYHGAIRVYRHEWILVFKRIQ